MRSSSSRAASRRARITTSNCFSRRSQVCSIWAEDFSSEAARVFSISCWRLAKLPATSRASWKVRGQAIFQAGDDALDGVLLNRFQSLMQTIESIGDERRRKHFCFAMTVRDALERAAEFGFDSLRPPGVQGLGVFLAGALDFFYAGFGPFGGLGGGDFDQDALGFVAQAGANVVEEHRGFVANGGDGCVGNHFFHLLLKIAHQVADGALRGGGARLRGESVSGWSDFGRPGFGLGGDGQLRMKNRDVL